MNYWMRILFIETRIWRSSWFPSSAFRKKFPSLSELYMYIYVSSKWHDLDMTRLTAMSWWRWNQLNAFPYWFSNMKWKRLWSSPYDNLSRHDKRVLSRSVCIWKYELVCDVLIITLSDIRYHLRKRFWSYWKKYNTLSIYFRKNTIFSTICSRTSTSLRRTLQILTYVWIIARSNLVVVWEMTPRCVDLTLFQCRAPFCIDSKSYYLYWSGIRFRSSMFSTLKRYPRQILTSFMSSESILKRSSSSKSRLSSNSICDLLVVHEDSQNLIRCQTRKSCTSSISRACLSI